VAVVIGAVAANALNVYSGSISFMALGIRLPTHSARAAVALVFGVIGLIVAFDGLNDVSKYENFLLVISYWIGPWLGVVLVDRFLRRGTDIQALLGDKKYLNWAGPSAMFVGGALSIWLFSNQTKYQGVLVKDHPALGDLTFEVGFAVAAILYFALFMLTKPQQGPPASKAPTPVAVAKSP
jgi:NCS1 family nucleobase:cation symporter-1